MTSRYFFLQMGKNVLIFSIKEDVHADRIEALLPHGYNSVRLNLDEPNDWSLSFTNRDVIVDTPNCRINLQDIKSVFVRRIPSFDSFKASVAKEYSVYAEYIAQQKFMLFSDCLSVLDHSVLFANPLASSQNLGKAAQQFWAERMGLKTPVTYVGTLQEEVKLMAENLFSAGLEMCTKPVASSKLLIDGEVKTRFTEKFTVNELGHLSTLGHCPIIFQQYIPKKFEIRGTIVGKKIFAARIDSQEAGEGTATDWRRYNIPKTPHYPYELPSDISARLVGLHKALGVHISSFDLIHTADGEFVFLETNPYGQWLWIEDLTGLKISEEIAQFLTRDLQNEG